MGTTINKYKFNKAVIWEWIEIHRHTFNEAVIWEQR